MPPLFIAYQYTVHDLRHIASGVVDWPQKINTSEEVKRLSDAIELSVAKKYRLSLVTAFVLTDFRRLEE